MDEQKRIVTPGLRVIFCIKFDPNAPAEEAMDLKRRLIDDCRTVHSVEVLGSFDFMMEVKIADLADYQQWREDFAQAFVALVDHHEANIVCRRYVRDAGGPLHHLWVSSGGGRVRIECDHIDHFSAEGDYVRAHTSSHSWLTNWSLAKLEKQLDPLEFIRLHRSTIARRDAIVRLRHQGRTWFALLASGVKLRIAKGHVSDVLRLVRDDSAGLHAVSATGEPLDEKDVVLTDEQMHWTI